jgi:molecular chaperone GrpE
MLNFETELNKLLARESEPLAHSELAELMLAALNKKHADISFQIEEIYDLTKEADTSVLRETLDTEKRRADKLTAAVVGLCDILEHFCAYARQSGSEHLASQAFLLLKNSTAVLEGCGITRLGEEGQALDPEIHTVQNAAASSFPREHVAQVLQSGYRYLGEVVRRASVIVSTGPENFETGGTENEQNRWY